MALIACPHCAAANESGSVFCQACGKALPGADPSMPRVVSGSALAGTSAGVKLQGDELRKEASKAANALLVVAVLQTIGAAVVFVMFYNLGARTMARFNLTAIYMPVFGLAALFWGLYLWARVNPLPAAIVGLVVYVTVWIVDALMTAAVLARTQQAGRPGAGGGVAGGVFGGIGLRIIIIVMLVRAIQAGALHRKLLRQQQQQGIPPLSV